MARAFLVVMDSVGCGGAPDADRFFNGDLPDTGANTLGHIAVACDAGQAEEGRSGPLHLPNLARLGLGHALALASGVTAPALMTDPRGLWGAATEISPGKDTPSGHWELAGLPVPWDWHYFPDETPAFPADLTAEVARAAGIAVAIVPGEADNLKITGPADFDRAAGILNARNLKGQPMGIRLGNGFDVHRFGPGDHVMLCGVAVPHGRGLQGHSDADVGMHAITDAIYGALAEGDIGRHFPPSDPQWKGAASEIFLRHAADLARAKGWQIANIDCTLICERPKVGPHAGAMQAALAAIMGVDPGAVSVKATTSERLGFTGREEGIAALATAALVAA